MLGEYQALAAETAWAGTRGRHPGAERQTPRPAARRAERVYDAGLAHRAHLPDRLLRSAA